MQLLVQICAYAAVIPWILRKFVRIFYHGRIVCVPVRVLRCAIAADVMDYKLTFTI